MEGEDGSTFSWKDKIEEMYYTAKNAGSFCGPAKLHSVLKKMDPSCTLQRVKEWIQNQETYNVHRARKLKFERRKMVRLRPYETTSYASIQREDPKIYGTTFFFFSSRTIVTYGGVVCSLSTPVLRNSILF